MNPIGASASAKRTMILVVYCRVTRVRGAMKHLTQYTHTNTIACPERLCSIIYMESPRPMRQLLSEKQPE